MGIFVTDSGYKHTLGIVRSLGSRNLAVDVGSPYSDSQLCSFSKYCHRSFVYPDPKKDLNGFVRFFSRVGMSLGDRIVVPVGYTTTFFLSMKRDVLGQDIVVPLADFQSLKVAANKGDSVLLAQKLGVPVPKTIIVGRFSELEDVNIPSYPVVVKGAIEGGCIRHAYSKQDLKAKFEEVSYLQGCLPLIQEFISGDGYGFFALFNHGEPRAIFMHKRLRERFVMGGPSTCAESVYDSKLLDYGLRILKALKWHGVAMVEFKKDSVDGEFKLMEINPKFWGSLDLGIASGVDFPYLLYRMVEDGDVHPVFHIPQVSNFSGLFPMICFML